MAAEKPRVTPGTDHPPAWAQAFLPWLVRGERLEAIEGDLLEAYRDTILPSRGRRRANAWYFRQVFGFLIRLAWPFALLTAAALVLRGIFDTAVPTLDYSLRSAVTTYTAIGTYFTAGAYGTYRTRHIPAGVLTALAAHTFGCILTIILQVVEYSFFISPDAERLRHFEMTGGWGETIGLPILLLPFVNLIGVFGALTGRALAPRKALVD